MLWLLGKTNDSNYHDPMESRAAGIHELNKYSEWSKQIYTER